MFGVRSADDVKETAAALPELQTLLKEERPPQPVSARVTLKKNQPIYAAVRTDDGLEAAVSGPVPEQAQGRPVTEEMVAQAFAKTGGTPFGLAQLDIQLDDGLFVQKSVLNALRRDALESLIQMKTIPFHRTPRAVRLPDFPAAPMGKRRFFALLESAAQLTEETAGAFDMIGLPAAQITPEAVALAGADRLCAVPSRAPFGAEKQQLQQLLRAASLGVNRCYVHTLDGITLAKAAGMTECVGGHTLNCGNAVTAARLRDLGLTALCVTAEVHPDTVSSHWPEGLECGAVVYGRLPFMLTRNCPAKNIPDWPGCGKHCGLKDRKGRILPLRCDGHASELLNPVPLWLADRLDEIKSPSLLVFLFDRQTPEECAAVARAYRQGQPCTGKEYTRGNVFRPVE